jgi:hypothetical protein
MGKNKAMVEEFTTNQNNVIIKKCCASCKWKIPHDTEGPRRKCTFKNPNKIVDKSDLCGNWEISEMIDIIKLRPNGIQK